FACFLLWIVLPCRAQEVEPLKVVGVLGNTAALSDCPVPYAFYSGIAVRGMGAVYLAEDTSVGRKVAVKVLPKKYSDEREFLTRFRREAQATGRLTGTYKGIGMVVCGLGLFLGIAYYGKHPGYTTYQALIVLGPMGVWFLLMTFAGLTRLLGSHRLMISPEQIAFRSTLLGIFPFYWKTLRTAEVISAGSSVIRTAAKQISFGDYVRDAVRTDAERSWLAGEIALRIQAARTGTRVPPLGSRR
ncbi:MAG: hypothetical protein NTW87_27450, partial [Planctomycetota bacterium]|nr:hypothetical protein [Planctomycetota bacterium]